MALLGKVGSTLGKPFGAGKDSGGLMDFIRGQGLVPPSGAAAPKGPSRELGREGFMKKLMERFGSRGLSGSAGLRGGGRSRPDGSFMAPPPAGRREGGKEKDGPLSKKLLERFMDEYAGRKGGKVAVSRQGLGERMGGISKVLR